MFEPEFNDWMNILMFSNFVYIANIYNYNVALILFLYAQVAGFPNFYIFVSLFLCLSVYF